MGIGGVFRDRNASVYLGAVVVSSFGSGAMSLAAGVWVMTLTDNSSLAALVMVLLWAPTLAGPFIGAAIDRIGRHRAVLVGTMAGTGALMLTLVAVRSAAWLWLLFTVMFIYGIAYVAIFAAESALLPLVVPPTLLGDVNGLRMSAAESTKLIAPLVGAGLFTAWGGGAVALLDAVSFGIAALLCLLMKPVRAAPVKRERIRVRDGLRYLAEMVHLRRVVVSAGVALVLAGFASTMTFALIDEGLGLAPAFVGVLAAVQGTGSVVSGLVAGAVLRRLSPLGFAAIGLALFAIGVLLRMTSLLPLVLIGSVVGGLGLPAPLVAATTTMQLDSPPELLARITGSVQLVMYAPNALAQALGAVVVGFVDFRVSLAVVGVVGLVAAGWAAWTVLGSREDRSRAPVVSS
ncbi:MFS transporter [Actinokineospora diospyrosa]|uniref:Arabinose efflux permease, MFS family n=1 Tax=Actinokineospora diospyrosa TaxID=103728 RepID=A0ABT1IGL3_9PSEU|nr:MFS transporter [Actinokineospora diospyrosa]MCP2271411.1 putative arabinose efflux permease, MFS family [Actinokineospora diospyrosa]